MNKGLIQIDQFYCDHLGVNVNDEKDVRNFSIRSQNGHGLLNYLLHKSFYDEDAHLMRTYLVRDISSDEIVGYFSLKAGLVSTEEQEIEIYNTDSNEPSTRITFDTIPGIELANFAVNSAYIAKHPGISGVGLFIFDSFILPITRQVSTEIGAFVLYIFSLPFENLIDRYKKYGFMRLEKEYEDKLHKRLKPEYDQSCIFMYRPLE